MTIGLSSMNAAATARVVRQLDKTGGLYQTSLPGSTLRNTFALAVSTTTLNSSSVVPAGVTYLKGADNNYFAADLKTTDKVNLVASGDTLNLYVYSGAGAANKYTFDGSGVLTSVADGGIYAPAALDTQGFWAEELTTQRDLDGNGSIGAALSKTSGATAGVLDAIGGIYRVSVMGRNAFVVGTGLERAATIAGATTALLDGDGQLWTPDRAYARYAAIKTPAGEDFLWDIYAVSAKGEITKFSFDADRKLIAAEDRRVSAQALAAVEKTRQRDLNADGVYGVSINTAPVDTAGGLYKGRVLGQDFYLIGSNLKTGTATAGTDLAGSLLDEDGSAWTVAAGYTISALVKNTSGDGSDVAADYSIYAYRTARGKIPADKNDVLRFDFSSASDGNYHISAADRGGVKEDAIALAKAEKASTRDLNADSVFGVKMMSVLDTTGGLFQASALGSTFLLTGVSLASPSTNPLDLGAALLTAEGNAWLPEGVNLADGKTKLSIVPKVVADNTVGFDVYAVNKTSNTFTKYSFGGEAGNTHVLSGTPLDLTLADLAAAEKTTRRDLDGDGAYGAVIVGAAIDAKTGLYQASFGAQSKFYLRSDSLLAEGSKAATKAVDFSRALLTPEGYCWDVAAGYKIQAAFEDSGNYSVVATATARPQDVRRYVFDPDNRLVEADSGDWSLANLAVAENTQKRDLNGDAIVGVKLVGLPDKAGNLYIAETSNQLFFTVRQPPAVVQNLDTALLNADGTAAWAPPGGLSKDVNNVINSNFSKFVLTPNATTSGVDLYLVNNQSPAGYSRYSFGSDYQYMEGSEKTLTLLELADEEKKTTRDINGDGAVGAVLSALVDRAGGLYQAKIDGVTMTVVAPAFPGKKISLSDKVLFNGDGAAWQVSTGFTLRSVTGNVAGAAGAGDISVYASNTTSGAVRRYTFSADRVLSGVENLDASDLVAAEKLANRDLNVDQAVGLSINSMPVDKTGGLFKTTVLDQSFYVIGQNLRTGRTGGDNAVDLSTALRGRDGVAAWQPAAGFQIGGLVTTRASDEGEPTGYEVYSYTKDSAGQISGVRRDSWDANYLFVDSVAVNAVELVQVEARTRRDLSGDGAVGFRQVSDVAAGYQGVTQGRVYGSANYWLVGSNLRAGSPSHPLDITSALLSADGTLPWNPDAGFMIKSVDEAADLGNGSQRYVYAADASNHVVRYAFDKATGRSSGAAVAVDALTVSQREMAVKRDLNGDGARGVVTVAKLMDADSPQRETGFLSAAMMGQNFIVVKKLPAAGRGMDLSGVLLNQDGTAWAAPVDFKLKGVYQPTAATTEVFGVAGDTFGRYVFTAADDDSGAWLYPGASDPAPSTTVAGRALAEREAVAGKDLSGDASIGFKPAADNPLATQSNGWAVGKAGIGASAANDIYIVGKGLQKMGAVARNMANSAALWNSDTPTYWQPDANYSVVGIVESDAASTVDLYARTGTGATAGNMKYRFTLQDSQWTLASQAVLSGGNLVSDEVALRRDLNSDGAVGLSVADTSVHGLAKANVLGQDYYLIGSTLATGTPSKPLGFDAILLNGDGSAAWTPADGATLDNFLTFTLAPAGHSTAKYAVDVTTANSLTTVTQYFDSARQAIA